ncbi:MAG: hypothetical protein MJ197_09220 [Bacteroidales bacterium]|nr:hypothetical protein [Bacteroidales bacterium]
MKKYVVFSVLGVFVFVLLFCFYRGSFNKQSKGNSNVKIEDKELGYGIDLSHFNSVENWDNVSASFVLLKATEGATCQDNTFKKNRAQAQKRGIPVGAYHLMSSSSKIKKQIQNYFNMVGDNIDIIPILDLEVKTASKLGKKSSRKMVREFANACKEKYGCSSIILYTSEGYYKKYFSTGFEDCIFWSGDVNVKKQIKCAIRQKTIKSVPGVKGKVDFDVLYCELSDLMLKK